MRSTNPAAQTLFSADGARYDRAATGRVAEGEPDASVFFGEPRVHTLADRIVAASSLCGFMLGPGDRSRACERGDMRRLGLAKANCKVEGR